MKKKRLKFVLPAFVLPVLIALLLPVRAFADKGIEVTVDSGYRFSIVCHYEPDQHAEVTYVDAINNQAPDTLTIPDMVIAYNDTFPVTRLNVVKCIDIPSDRPQPKVVDFGRCSHISIRQSWIENNTCVFDSRLRDVIFNVPVDTLDCSFHNTALTDIDLTNVSNIMSADYIRDIVGYPLNTYYHYGLFENCRSLRSVKLSTQTSIIPVRTFYRSGLMEADFPYVKVIGKDAFRESDLNSMTLASVDTISDSAFSDCSDLSSISLNEDIHYVWENIFNGTALTELNFHNAVSDNGLYKYVGELTICPITSIISNMPYLNSLSG